ncbi:ECF transporter S component [Mycoplasma sp. P36-A1]|uniref:ECF transporter S component n=1 Tax=Mycoplasma sp. P36-A1 TaxID=3252900 RepID=UPI003C2B25F9
MKNMYKWELKDIIMIGLISIIFGIIYLGAVHIGIYLGVLLTPLGLGILANEFIFGIWFMAATLAVYIIRKPGVATIAEMLAALIEVFLGNMYGPIIFVSGLVQGIGSEAAFFATSYKSYSMKTFTISALGATITSFIWGFFRSNFTGISIGMLVAIFVIRFISAWFFSGFLVKKLVDALAKTGVLENYEINNNEV